MLVPTRDQRCAVRDAACGRVSLALDLGIGHGIFKKVSNKIQFPDGRSDFESRINKDPQKWFTDDVLKALDAAAAKEFKYGQQEAGDDVE